MAQPPPECPMHQDNAAKAGNEQKVAGGEKKCPVDHEAMARLQQVKRTPTEPGSCPVDHEKIDPTNMMPVNPKQQPHPEQTFPLPTERVVSNIPKADTENPEETWVFPSPQMFYNAIKRKGGDADEEAMSQVVGVHNSTNEYCWGLIMEWEKAHCNECDDPRLRKFRGKYGDISPKARMKMLIGYDRPFDRHDWVVDRCGKDVRYVIDYYHTKEPNPDMFGMHMELDVRPALDSVGSLWDRIRKLF